MTWALWPRKLELVTPRARPSGNGDPQSARSAASSSARTVRRLPTSSSRRTSTGSRPVAIASSSTADSRANSVCELPTDRHTIVGIGVSTLVDSMRKFRTAYGGSTAPVDVGIPNGIAPTIAALRRHRARAVSASSPIEEALKLVPMGRVGEAEEVAAVVAFLVSDAASYVTRQVIGVNGGIA